MPLSGIAEAILQPVFEVVFRAAGYLTGYVVVPIFTLGRVLVEPDSSKQIIFPAKGGIKRRSDGVFVVEAELGTLCGLVFWVLVGVGVFVYHHHA
ncbi:hypothetical protein BH09PAT4_BH09PAT4_09130 [soil metagenome]